jgi:hypothetical protein
MTQSPPPSPQPPPPSYGHYPPGVINYEGVIYDRDTEHLRILKICWYVASGLAAMFGSIPLIHTAMGLFLIIARPGGPTGPPVFVGWMVFIIGLAFVCFGWTSAILGFLAARSLGQRRRLMLCYIAAGLYCVQVPIGALLGIFTFIVLTRPSVKATFV